MQEWVQFFKITYHPDGENYIVHWADTHVPVDIRGWRVRENAIRWIETNWQALIAERFEEVVFGQKG
jgi:hypothetical protein